MPNSVSDGSEGVLLRPEIDRILGILRKRHRRKTLLLLKRGAVETEAEILLQSENETKEDEMALAHTHLPKLDDAGYIEWNQETGDISKGPRFGEIEPLLELIESHSDELPPDWP